MQSYQQTKRRKKRVLQSQVTKTVTVMRGKFGYGFTISGQSPCVLSCIVPGSPAQVAGLKAGDLLYVVNGQSVGRACHDDVVRMVGLSTGSLQLQVAENYNSSDSSDEDYLPRTKSRYPNRIRTQQSLGEKNFKYERISSSYPAAKQSGSRESLQQNHSGEEEYDLSSSLTSQEDQAWVNLEDVDKAMSEKKQDLTNDSDKQKINLAYSKFCSQPVISAAKKVSSAAAVVKRVPPVKDYLKQRFRDSMQHNCANILLKSQVSQAVVPRDREKNNVDTKAAENVTAIVGYIGSIETPSSHTRPHQRLQALRNAVKRLRLEKRVHTLVLMEVRPSGVLLTNAMGKQLASYPCDRIAYSGICPDDERFFGLVTLSVSHLAQHAGGDRLRTPNSSCHIFMIEPDTGHHSAARDVPGCQVGCAADQQRGQCLRSAKSLILSIASLYRDKPSRKFDSDFVQSQAFADPTSHCNNSNSRTDNNLRLGREEKSLEQTGQVCVVEMSNSREELDTSSPSGAGSNNLSSEVDGAVERTPSSCLVSSPNDVECWQQVPHAANKLTLQAMPDPACLEVGVSDSSQMSLVVRGTENLKQNMQRYLEARQQLLEEQNCVLGSDGESYVGDNVLSLSVSEDGHAVLEAGNNGRWQSPEKAFVFAVPTNPPPISLHHKTGRSAFHLLRSPSAPLGKHSKPVTVDLDTAGKLSPRAFPHSPPTSSVLFRSPSAPLFPHRDSDDDEDEDCESDPYIRQILEQCNKDKMTAINDDSRRFSEGFPLTKKCLEEPAGTLGVQKWTKTGSFRKTEITVLKQSYSQSLESLAVGENAGTAANKLTTACSAHNIASHTRCHGVKANAGRVATWAVHFDKLLQDQLGIEVFTEFLANEFSDENIRFWKVCEQFRDLTNDLQRKEQAKDIFARHLSTKASDPVNVDNAARSHTEKLLDNPTALMFDVAQQQIIQLMRLDSYPRFLKSDLYKNMLVKELEGNTQAELQEASNSKLVTKQSNGKENGGKRRRSILPWKHEKSVKVASEFKKLNKKGTINQRTNNNILLNVNMATTTTSHVAGLKKTTGVGIDLSTMRREVFHQNEVHDNDECLVKFCRIIMPDGSTTVVSAKPGQTCCSILSKLCDKRAISIASVEVFLLGSDMPLDLSEDISTLGSKEIVIERRVLFRLDLPDGKSVGAKAKPNRSIRIVLKPILEKYGYNSDNIGLKLTSCPEMIDLEMPVSLLDNQRAVLVSHPDMAGVQKQRKAPLFGLFRMSDRRFLDHKKQHQWQGDLHQHPQAIEYKDTIK